MTSDYGLFGSSFLKLFLRLVFENIENIILMFLEDYSYSLNLVFFFLCFFFLIKKKKPNTFFIVFSLFFLFFKTKNNFQKV